MNAGGWHPKKERWMKEENGRYKWAIQVLVYLGAITNACIWFSIGPMLITLTKDLDISFTEAGLLTGIVALIMGFFALVSGVVSGRFGLKNTACIGLTVISFGCILSGLVSNYAIVLTGRILYAVGAGFFFPMVGAMVMQWFKGKELVIVNSINFSGGTAGVAVGMVITTPIMEMIGWRMTLISYGFFAAGLATLAWIFLKDRQVSVTPSEENPFCKTKNERTSADVFRAKETWYLAFAFAAPVSASIALGTFLPAYYVTAKGMSMAAAGRWASTVYLVGIPAAITGGLLGAKAGVRKPFLIFDGIILGVGILGAVLLSGKISFLFLILAGIGLLFYTGSLFTIPMEIEGMTPKTTGLMIGIMLFISMECAFLAPVLIGWIEEMTGSLKGGLVFYGVFSFLLAVLPLFIDETGPGVKMPEKVAA